jgi:CelD/BcsL family acetyltransferase involved in cellulose biosynthesis
VAGIELTKSSVSSVEVVTDSVRLRELADQWGGLWARTSGVGLFQSFEYCLDAWELVEEPRGCRLACVAGWRGDQLVAVWPMVTYRKRLWKHARQLVASGVELHEMLVDDSLDPAEWVRQAWSALTEHSQADVVDVSFFDDSATAPALRSLPARAVETTDLTSVSVKLRDEESWDAFYNSLSKSHRKDFAKSRRRLEALGALEFAVCEAGNDRIGPLIDWTLAQKRRWAEHTGKKGAWLYSDNYRAFLEHQLAAPGKGARNVLLVLTLNGQLLGTQIGAVSKGRFEAIIAGFNAEYDKFSPGTRLNEAMIRWSLEQGVDCDLGAGSEPYKTFWSRNQVVSLTARSMAISRRGVAAFALRRAVQHVRGWRTKGKSGADQ